MKCPHCDTPIDEHEANRCLSAWVHVDIFGYKLPDHNWRDTHCDCIRDYSHSIAAAWEVVEKLKELGFYGSVNITSWKTLPWNARFWTDFDARKGYDSCDTAPLAICRAAIKAIEKDRENVRKDD